MLRYFEFISENSSSDRSRRYGLFNYQYGVGCINAMGVLDCESEYLLGVAPA